MDISVPVGDIIDRLSERGRLEWDLALERARLAHVVTNLEQLQEANEQLRQAAEVDARGQALASMPVPSEPMPVPSEQPQAGRPTMNLLED